MSSRRTSGRYGSPSRTRRRGKASANASSPTGDGHVAVPIDDLATRLRMTPGARIAGLPHALRDPDELTRHIGRRRPAVFLDYDGTLTPIVDRPEDAVISGSMRAAVRGLAQRCPVCVVSGRDRRVVQDLMGVEDLIVAGSHGFDIWSPTEGRLEHGAGGGFEDLIERVTERVREKADAIEGSLVEAKKASVALHYRLVADADRPAIKAIVDRVLAEHPGELKVTPGKMVYEIQPKLEWDKGKAVLYLLEALGLHADDVAPLYLGDDITDEDAFRAMSGTGIGIFVGQADDPELAGRDTSAVFVLDSIEEVERFLDTLAR